MTDLSEDILLDCSGLAAPNAQDKEGHGWP